MLTRDLTRSRNFSQRFAVSRSLPSWIAVVISAKNQVLTISTDVKNMWKNYSSHEVLSLEVLCGTGKLIRSGNCFPLIPLTSFLAPRPLDRLHESAGDSLRLTRTGQAKSVEEHVPAFTQHTQLFHNRKSAPPARFPRRKYKHWQKKNENPFSLAKDSRKAERNCFGSSCGKAISAGREGFFARPAKAYRRPSEFLHRTPYLRSMRSNSKMPIGSPPMSKRSCSTTMALASSRA